MFCCRNFILPVLGASYGSPFLTLSILISYVLMARPCFYCSMILVTLLATSCYWRDTAIVEFTSLIDFFTPRAGEANDGIGLQWLRNLLGKRDLYYGRFGRITI